MMSLLWLFWLETLAFIAFILWTIFTRPGTAPLTGYQKAALVIYAAALLYTLYGFISFARRWLTVRAVK